MSETIVRVKTYHIKDPKNETSNRAVAAPSYVFEVLKRHYDSRKAINIGIGDRRVYDDFKPQYYSSRFSGLVLKFGMPKIRLHDLRHFNAVIMMVYGVPDKVAAERFGHSTTQTLRNVYQHVLPATDRTAADKIGKIFETTN